MSASYSSLVERDWYARIMRRSGLEVRPALIALLLALAVVLAVHGVSMARHGAAPDASMRHAQGSLALGGDIAFVLCFAIVVAGVVVAARIWRHATPVRRAAMRPLLPAVWHAPARTARHPPDEGTILRL